MKPVRPKIPHYQAVVDARKMSLAENYWAELGKSKKQSPTRRKRKSR